MKRLIILLFASLVTVGLLVACSNPSAQPMNGNGDGNGDGDGDGDGMTTDLMSSGDLDLTLLGWTGRVVDADTPANNSVAGSFTWSLEIDDSGTGGIDEDLYLVFSDGATDLSVNAGDTSPGTACAGLSDVDFEIAGLTISFSGTIGSGSCTDLIATFDPDGSGDAVARAPTEGDKLAFEITLAAAPDTTPVDKDDAKNQDIGVTGTMTITGGGDDDMGSVSFDISGEVTYTTPTITTQEANQ